MGRKYLSGSTKLLYVYIYKFIEIRLRYQWISNHLLGGDHPFGESALFHVPYDGFAKSMDVYLFVQTCLNPDNSNASNPSSFRHV